MEYLSLRPLTQENRQAYLALEVKDCQKAFIETPAQSLRDMEARGWDVDWTILCIFAGTTLAGYAMHGMNRRGDAWLDRFMIDRRFQGRGLGTRALPRILAEMKKCYPGRRSLLLSVEPENQTAIRLYERFGFRLTGEYDGPEAVMRLEEP